MAWWQDPAIVAMLVSSAALVGFAAWAGAQGGFRGRPAAFAVFAGGFGLAVLLEVVGILVMNARYDGCSACFDDPTHVAVWFPRLLAVVFNLVMLTGLVWLTALYGVQWRRWLWVVPVIAVVAGHLAQFPGESIVPSWTIHYVHWALYFGIPAVMAAGVAGLALAFRREPSQDRVILAVALAAYPAVVAASTAMGFGVGDEAWAPSLLYALLVTVPGFYFWLSTPTGTGNLAPRAAPACVAAFLLLSYLTYGTWMASSVARVFDILVVSWAIVRHRYLGIDLRVRWAVGKSTIAALFVTVFFVASEVAQAFFGDQLRSEYWGIAAAGILVFAIVPLQRLADSMAAAAVPVQREQPEKVFKAAVRAAMRDGTVHPREERHLAEVATELSLTPSEVVRFKQQVAAELSDAKASTG